MRHIGGKETERIALIDGNNLIHRAYFSYVDSRLKAGKPLYSSPDGFPTGVIYGALDMLTSWLQDIKSLTRICVFFDGISKRRLSLDPEYKISRTQESSRGLKLVETTGACLTKKLQDGYVANSEVDILAHLFPLLGCDVFHHPEEEADDLIASFCKQNEGAIRIIISSDKDFFQLLQDPRVICYVPGVEGDRFYDAERSELYWSRLLKGKHPSVPPSHVRMFKTLCGDSSDDIIGVNLLRKKVAVQLCHLKSIDDVLASGFPGFSKSEQEKTIAAEARLRVNYVLAGMFDNIDLSNCVRKATPDYGVARSIVQYDLNIQSVDLSVFRLGARSTDEVNVPIDSWLNDITLD